MRHTERPAPGGGCQHRSASPGRDSESQIHEPVSRDKSCAHILLLGLTRIYEPGSWAGSIILHGTQKIMDIPAFQQISTISAREKIWQATQYVAGFL